MRIVVLLLILSTCLGVATGTDNPLRMLMDIALCAIFGLGLHVIAQTRRRHLWLKRMCVVVCLACVLTLMLLNARFMIAGLLFFVLIPGIAGMPIAERVAVYLSVFAVFIFIYITKVPLATLDPVIPLSQSMGMLAIIVFAEVMRRHNESVEETRKLLDALIETQKSLPDPQNPAHSAETAPHLPKPKLSPREKQILALIAKGFSNKEIADRLYLVEGTVKNRVSDILQKVDARDRTNAALKARELDLI